MRNLTEALKKKVSEIEDKADYDDLMENIKLSSAPLEIRQEAINYLKTQHPQYDEKRHTPTKEVLQMIKDGESDISDIGNGY